MPVGTDRTQLNVDPSEIDTVGPTPIVRFAGRFVTIGYQGRSLDDFLRELTLAEVDILVDVREKAISRRAGFSRKSLSAGAESVGIEYRHEPLLGNPKSNRDDFRAGNVGARRLFLRHLNNGSRSTFEDLVDLAQTKVVALVCFERDHHECHRSCITEQAQSEHPALLVHRL